MKINNTTFNSASLPEVWGRNNAKTNKLLEVLDKIKKFPNIVFTPIRVTSNYISNKTSDLINYLSRLIFGKPEIMDTSIPEYKSPIRRSYSLPDLRKCSSENENEKFDIDLSCVYRKNNEDQPEKELLKIMNTKELNAFKILNTAKNNNQVVNMQYLQCDLKMGYSSALYIMKINEELN